MPTNQEYLDRVEKIIALRNLTQSTVRRYLFMCNRFLSWCDTLGITPEEISVEQVQSYILNLKNVIHFGRGVRIVFSLSEIFYGTEYL